jgi:tripartite-type tricarboxylate transporter receptor subunit TctC
MLLPAGTPKAIVAKISRDTGRALNLPEVKELLSGVGALPTPGTPDAFASYLKSEIEKWGDVIRRAGIRAE